MRISDLESHQKDTEFLYKSLPLQCHDFHEKIVPANVDQIEFYYKSMTNRGSNIKLELRFFFLLKVKVFLDVLLYKYYYTSISFFIYLLPKQCGAYLWKAIGSISWFWKLKENAVGQIKCCDVRLNCWFYSNFWVFCEVNAYFHHL